MSHPAGATSSRAANFERLRVLAVLDIIAFHVTGERGFPLFGGGLISFLLLAQLFNVAVSEKQGVASFVRVKVRRLLLPWLFWSAVYGALWIGLSLKRGQPWDTLLDWKMLTYGTSEHLWFVPFSALTGVLVAVAQSRFARVPTTWAVAVALAAGGVLIAVSARLVDGGGLDVPVVQYCYAMPAPFLGFALGRLWLLDDVRKRRWISLVVGALGLWLFAATLTFAWPNVVARWGMVMAVLLVFLEWRGELDALTRFLSPLLYGVYLVHQVWAELTARVAVLNVHPSVRVVAVFLGSVLMTRALKATRLREIV